MAAADFTPPVRGRGSAENPPNRFDRIAYERDPEAEPLEAPRTEYLPDHARTIIASNCCGDLPFARSVNPYRGCEHGCAYCYARPSHEYFGLSAGLDFETKVFVKFEAPTLLARELAAPRWQPQPVGMSGVTDPYQPVERRLALTRGCLAVLARFRNPVSLITKNALVTRDLDLLRELAAHRAVGVHLSITTLDSALAARLEPRCSGPPARLDAVAALAAAGVPVGVLVAPVIPGLNDHEVPAVITAAARAGAVSAHALLLRLPPPVDEIFTRWLERHAPGRRDAVLARLRAMRGGRLNVGVGAPDWLRGSGHEADALHRLAALTARKCGLAPRLPPLSAAAFRAPGRSLPLFPAPA